MSEACYSGGLPCGLSELQGERARGSIEKGKYADLAILSDDLLSMDKHAIKNI